MRVLQVVPSLASRTGGPATSVVESSLALQRAGVDVTIFATDMAEAASSATHARATMADLPGGARDLDVRLFRATAPYRLAFSRDLWEALGDEVRGYDVVHIHSLFLFPQFAAYRAARGTGVPYVVSPRGALDPYLRRRGRAVKVMADRLWQREMLAGAAAIHATSDEEARQVAAVAGGRSCHVVSNGVWCDDYAQLPDGAAFRARHFAESDEPIVMYLGRISQKKRVDLLIRAFAMIQRTGVAARLAIVGPDDEGLTPGLRALARRQGVADRVVFAGMLRGHDKLDALAAADVWALPSHGENFGNAVVEALAAGRATVISPHINIAGAFADAGAGIVAPLTAEAFAAAIGGLLRDAERRAALGARARAFARTYDWSVVGPRLAAMYGDVVSRPGVSGEVGCAHSGYI